MTQKELCKKIDAEITKNAKKSAEKIIARNEAMENVVITVTKDKP